MNKITYLAMQRGCRDVFQEPKKSDFDILLLARQKDPLLALVLSLFLGGWGVDRFYVGDVLLGVLKFFTLGGLGVWIIIDWFLIMSAAYKKNIEIMNEIKMTMT